MSYNPDTPRVSQTDSWSCSVASTAWLLRSLGLDGPYPGLENEMLGAGLVGRADGLQDGSGASLANWLTRTYGLSAHNERVVGWDWLLEHAGSMPILTGGHTWNHWVGVRARGDNALFLANPSDGWMGIHQVLYAADFARLGSFSCVWVELEENTVNNDELVSLLGYLQGDVADALQEGVEGARAAKTKRDRGNALEAIEDAIQTLRRGG